MRLASTRLGGGSGSFVSPGGLLLTNQHIGRDAVTKLSTPQKDYNFDITFLRVYENGQPAKTEHYLKWSKNGAAEGELIFAPGVTEIEKPNAQRYPEFTDARLDGVKASLLSPAPVYLDLEEATLAAWLEDGLKTLGADDPFITAALGGKAPADVVKQVMAGTKLADIATRRGLVDGGPSAIKASTDPLIDLARRVEPIIRELRASKEARIASVEASAGEKIARARFAVYGKTVYPDANFNLRLEYGTVAGYEEDTTLVPFKTTFFGLYERAASFNEKPPFDLPARWREGRSKLDLAVPFNFVYTADTIGGNSGSPIINRHAEIVGINFDSNIQKLPNRYLYIDESEGSRAVGVHSAGIIEALRKLYRADRLVEELTGKQP